MEFETLAARALNASRTIHKPTYAGLRILVSSLAKNEAAFKSFLARRCLSRPSWRYMSFEIVKEAPKGETPTYRNCITGSPLSTLAEAHILDLMAGQAAFAVPWCAYSYLWPGGGMTGRSFVHFIDGYGRRNVRVAELLSTLPRHVAVVADIRSFYPSVDRQRLRDKVTARAGQIQDQAIAGPIRKFTEAFLTLPVPRVGIPIGPDLSHVLGHVALESVDSALMQKYGNRYLRYVDDIIIVCPKSEAARAVVKLRQVLAAEGLTVNEAKQDEVERGEKIRKTIMSSRSDSNDSPFTGVEK